MRYLCALVGVVVMLACGARPAPHEVSPAIADVLSGTPPPTVEPAVWTDVHAFYTPRQHAPAWVDARRPAATAGEAIAVLKTARQHGFEAGEYAVPDLLAAAQRLAALDKSSPERLAALAAFDVRLTASLLAFGRDVAVGRARVRYWKPRRTAPEYAAALADAAGGDITTWAERMRPPHPEYLSLQRALDALHGQQEKGGWPAVPRRLSPGAAGPDVTTLKRRLAMSGQFAGDPEAGGAYDADVAAAVKGFQALHAIKATGIVDAPTLAAMNVPLDARIRQVGLNLQRWRWMPDDLGARHLFVNVPYFHVIAREHGTPVMDIRVVVGTTGNKTPIFSDEMESVVFSPYWNIPDSIAQGETLPALARDPSYLARQNIEILRVSSTGAEPVAPGEVNWDDPDALQAYSFRQKPGAGNALGHVKFLFPNPHNVYLHDTPADNLFGKPTRAFSHGCVRVEEPEALAEYVLREDPAWTLEAIGAAMHAGVETHVRLNAPIPVHIAYFTAWVDQNGGLHFQPDIYGYDRPRPE